MTTIGRVQVRRWPAEDPARLVVLVHGYGEHIGRYEHVAEALVARGSTCGARPRRSRTLAGRAGARRGLRAGRRRPARGGARGARRPAGGHGRALDGRPDRHPLRPAPPRGPRRPRAQRPGGRARPGVRGLARRTGAAVGSDRRRLLSRDPAVGEAYAADPLVWHGGWKRPTLEAFVAADRRSPRARASATCRCSTSTAGTTSSCRSTSHARSSSASRAPTASCTFSTARATRSSTRSARRRRSSSWPVRRAGHGALIASDRRDTLFVKLPHL